MTLQQNGVRTIEGGSLIRKVLLTNVVSSGAVGLILLLFPGFAGHWTGLDNHTAVAGTGVFLLVVVAFLLWTATRNVVSPRQVLVFSIIDLLWVIDSALLLGVSGSVTTIGIAAIILVAAVVGVFAAFEMSYFWRNRYYRK